jgi:hypothetical protein
MRLKNSPKQCRSQNIQYVTGLCGEQRLRPNKKRCATGVNTSCVTMSVMVLTTQSLRLANSKLTIIIQNSSREVNFIVSHDCSQRFVQASSVHVLSRYFDGCLSMACAWARAWRCATFAWLSSCLDNIFPGVIKLSWSNHHDVGCCCFSPNAAVALRLSMRGGNQHQFCKVCARSLSLWRSVFLDYLSTWPLAK